MWFMIPVAIMAATVGWYVSRDKTYKQRQLAPQQADPLRDDQVLAVATRIKTMAGEGVAGIVDGNTGAQVGDARITATLGFLNPSDRTRVVHLAIGMGGHAGVLLASLAKVTS